MADTRKIVVELVQREEGSAIPQPTPTPSGDTKTKEKTTSEGKILLKSVILNQGYNTAKRLVIQGVQANINHYFALSEDYMGENTYNNVMATLNNIKGMASSVIGGAVAGSVAGPIGAGVGALIGATSGVVSNYLSFQQRMSSYYQNLNASNYQTAYARKRAGLTDGGKGTEN